MRIHFTKLFSLLVFVAFLFSGNVVAQAPGTGTGSTPKCNTTCPPFTYQDPLTCACTVTRGNECIPFSCDDGDPCTTGDFETRNFRDVVCEPCAGKLVEITSIRVVRRRDCDDKGTTDRSDDTFIGDIIVDFNYAPVIDDFIITGDAYFSYKEDYCEVNGSRITISGRTFAADGDFITLHGILNDRVSCSYTKNGLAGKAFNGCGDREVTERPCLRPLNPNARGCIKGITIDQIFDCYDNGSVHNTSDDYLEAKVTVHFGEELPASGVLELSGMVATHVDLGKVSGSSYTFPGRLRLSYKNDNTLTVVAADYHSSHARICPINEYCSYTDDRVFRCNDPCGSSFTSSGNESLLIGDNGSVLAPNTATKFSTNMTVFPNPAVDNIYLTLSGIDAGMVNVQVFDMAGKLHVSKATDFQDTAIPLNISDLNAGLYLIRVEQNGKIFTDRVIKNQ